MNRALLVVPLAAAVLASLALREDSSPLTAPLGDRISSPPRSGGEVGRGGPPPQPSPRFAGGGSTSEVPFLVHGGTPEETFGIHFTPTPIAGDAEAVARVLVGRLEPLMGAWTVASREHAGRGALLVERAVLVGRTTIVTLDPEIDGVAVARGRLILELRDGEDGLEPVSLHGRVMTPPTIENEPSRVTLDAIAARSSVLEDARVRIAPARRLVVWPTAAGRARLALEVATLETRDTFDATTGELLASEALGCTGDAQGLAYTLDPRDTPRAPHPLEGLRVTQGSTTVTTDARGAYGLTGSVTLAQGLCGTAVRVVPTKQVPSPGLFGGTVAAPAPELALSYTGPADFTLAPPESSEQEDEVAAYSYTSSYNAYLRATYPVVGYFSNDATRPPAASRRYLIEPAQPSPTAFLAGYATYGGLPPLVIDGEQYDGYIYYGTLQAADAGPLAPLSIARESLVARHEYTHAILQGMCTISGTCVDEALADYFPCAMEENPLWAQACGPRFFRDLSGATGKLVYPQDALPSFEIHRVGNIIGQALWEARTAAEAKKPGDRLAVDQAVMAAVIRLPVYAGVLDIRECVVAGDRDVNGGVHVALLEQAFYDHGIGGPVGTTPSLGPPPVIVRPLSIVEAATLQGSTVAPASLATAFGTGLAVPTNPAGTTVTVTDSSGATLAATVSYVSSAQVNFAVPAATALGRAKVTIVASDGTKSSGTVVVAATAPGIFVTAQGVAAANVIAVDATGAQSLEPVTQIDPTAGSLYLVLYGTGIRGAASVTALVNGVAATVLYAGPQGGFEGLDQVNLMLPSLPPATASIPVVLTVAGTTTNIATIGTR